MDSGTRYLLLANPSSAGGRGIELLPRVERAFTERGLERRTVRTRGIEHACAEALAGAGEGEIPVVMSGDGLVGQVGGSLAGSQAPLGIIPAGRGNDLARVLGIPVEPEAAIEVLATGIERPIDVGEANGKRFLGVASCGFDSDANRIANEARWVKGRLVYAYAALRALATWKPARFTLTLDGARHEFSGYSVAAANSAAFGGGMFVAPDAQLDDGQLDVVCVAQTSKLRYLRGLPKVFDGSHVSEEQVSVARAAEVTIEADRTFAVYADGDPLTDLPATVRILSRALRVIAPAPEPPS